MKTAVPLEWGEAHFRDPEGDVCAGADDVSPVWRGSPATDTFADECLLVPTMDLASVAIDTDDHWVLDFHPHSPEKTRLDDYRVRLGDLPSRVEAGSRATG